MSLRPRETHNRCAWPLIVLPKPSHCSTRITNLHLKSKCSSARAATYDLLKEFDQSARDFRSAEDMFRKLGDHKNEASAAAMSADAEREGNHFDEAIRDFERAVEIGHESGDLSTEAYMYYWLGTAWMHRPDPTKALVNFELGLKLYREVDDKAGEAHMLFVRGAALDALNRFEDAARSYLDAAKIRRDRQEKPDLAAALSNLGVDYRYLGRYKEALDVFAESAAIYHTDGDPEDEARVLLNSSVVYESLGDYAKAIDGYERVEKICRDHDNKLALGTALNNLGTAYDALGQSTKAIEYYTQAIQLQQQSKDRRGEGRTLTNLGYAYAELGDLKQAVTYYEQALKVAEEVHDASNLGIGSSNLGRAWSRLGDYPQAVSYLDRALIVLRGIKERRAEAKALSNLMEACAARGYTQLGVMYGKQSVNLFQAIRSDLRGLSSELQRSYVQGNETTYRKLSDLLIAQGRLPEAERTLDLLKLEEFFSFVRGDSNAAGPSGRIDLTPEERQWAQDSDGYLMAIGQRRGELMAKLENAPLTPDEEAQMGRLQEELKTGNAHFQQYLAKLASETAGTPDEAKVKGFREALGLRRTLRKLKHGAVAIYTLVGDDKYRAILVTPDAEKAYEYSISKADLTRAVQVFRKAIQSPDLDPRKPAQRLYDILIGPKLRADLRQAKAETLMWSLDGSLRYVPLAALYDGERYLVEQFRLEVFTPESKDTFTDQPAKAWTAAAFGVTKPYPDFEPLPAVAGELNGIVRSSGQKGAPMSGEVLLDERFTEAAFERALSQTYSVIHIASHFSFVPGDELNSFLLLGDGRHLTLEQLEALPPSRAFDLLTLSACNTGMGGGAQGKEVDGLGVLAQRQGAKAVLASLWEVSDESTSLLMRAFYEIRESHPGIIKSEALREAQLKMLRGGIQPGAGSGMGERGVNREWKRDGEAWDLPRFEKDQRIPFAHPYYWAPFFLIGNWL